MAGSFAMAGGVGAGVSQVRITDSAVQARANDRAEPVRDVGSAALRLIQRSLEVPGVSGRDLDLLA